MWTELNRLVLSLYTRVQIKKDEGQALVEYTLILALISVVAIAVLTNIGKDITSKLGEVEAKL
jgi:pilus assembly protein Flp/PilA